MEWLRLQGTPVSDLTPLAGLTSLQELWLCNAQVSDLTPLVGLKDVTIYLDKDQQVTVPKELEKRVRRVEW